jgi:hypothetical protein
VDSYQLVCPFLADDPLFARGVEFGLLYARLAKGPPRVRDYFQRDNQEQILLLASRLSYDVAVMRPHDSGWFWLDLRKRPA